MSLPLTDKFQPYLVLSKMIVYTNHLALHYILSKANAKPHLICWVLLLQEFDLKIKNNRRAENMAADHLSCLENPDKSIFMEWDIDDSFPMKCLYSIQVVN